MKTQLTFVAFLFLFCFNFSFAQFQPAIVQDWADYIGYQDTIIRIPVLQDAFDNIVTAGFTVDSITGPDIMVSKYKETSELIWQRTFSSAGYNRDQPTALAIDDSNNVYVAGSVFSTATNYDFVLLKYDSAGVLKWSKTYNGSANNYDVPSAIAVRDSFIYITGAINNAGTLLDFVTIQYNKRTGTQNWALTYDYASLFDIPVAIVASNDGDIYVTGGSQQTVLDWSYVMLTYGHAGNIKDTLREGGTGNGFARVNAVKNDGHGNFYLTGTAVGDPQDFDIKTIKIDAGDTVAWITQFTGASGLTDEGTGITTDNDGNVYVCGNTTNDNSDYIIIKYDSLGNELGIQTYDGENDDVATAMCTDAFGNIVVTGKSSQDGGETYNFYTIAYNQELEELWHHSFNGQFNGDDYATGIAADDHGNIYVTGQSQIDAEPAYEQVTIKLRTDYFVFPEESGPVTTNKLFYPNTGQILNDTGAVADSVFNYSTNQYPQIYFHNAGISFVLSKIDMDTATVDSLERIDMQFYNGSMGENSPLQTNIHDTDQVLNYFLGHCPEGITGVLGAEKLTYDDVYGGVDVIFSNNNAGMKFQIVISGIEGGDVEPVQLHFTGHQQLSLISNSDLRIEGVLGSVTYERPLVYQLDDEGVRIPVGWLASYNIIDSANVTFTFGGSYDPERPLVIECARQVGTGASSSNLDWSTYFGGTGNQEGFFDVATDKSNDVYTVGETNAGVFPVLHSLQTFAGFTDMTITKFNKEASLIWNTFYGGYQYDWGTSITVATQNDTDYVCVTGLTASFDFPRFPMIDPANGEYFDTLLSGTADAFLVKLIATPNSSWDFKPWSQLIGGCAGEEGMSIVHDDSGNVYMCGWSDSPQSACSGANKFPIRFPNATAYHQNYQPAGTSRNSGFVMEFTPGNFLHWSTLYGAGYESTTFYDLTYDKATGSIYVGGTSWAGLQTTQSAPVVATNDSLLNLCNPGGSAYFQQIADFDQGILLRFNPLHELNWATLVGCNDGMATGTSVATNSLGDIYFTGYTYCDTPDFYCAPPVDYGFPLCSPIQAHNTNVLANVYGADMFLSRFDSSGALAFSTFYGGRTDERGDPAIFTRKQLPLVFTDQRDNVFVTGYTKYTTFVPYNDFPDHPHSNCYNQPQIAGTVPNSDAFLLWLDSTNALQWSTLFGGDDDDNVFGGVEADNYQIYLVGVTKSYNFPMACPNPGALPPWCDTLINSGQDGYISRFDVRTLIGVNEIIDQNSDIIIYPNPTTSTITIKINLENMSKTTMTILNSLGETVIQSSLKVSDSEFNVNVEDLSPGIYFLQINSKEGLLGCRKIIKL